MQGLFFPVKELASNWGLSSEDLNQIPAAVDALCAKGFVKLIGEGPIVTITPQGIELVESSMKPAKKPSKKNKRK